MPGAAIYLVVCLSSMQKALVIPSPYKTMEACTEDLVKLVPYREPGEKDLCVWAPGPSINMDAVCNELVVWKANR